MPETLYKCKHCNNVVAVEYTTELEQCSCGEGRESMNTNHWKAIGTAV